MKKGEFGVRSKIGMHIYNMPPFSVKKIIEDYFFFQNKSFEQSYRLEIVNEDGLQNAESVWQ